MTTPPTQYVGVDGARLAYQVVGDGPVDVVLSAGTFSNTDVLWEDPAAAVFLTRLASTTRLIRYDRLGTSNSDPLPSGWEPDSETFRRELDAVLGAVGTDAVTLVAMLDAGPMAIEYATQRPDRVARLVLYNTTACFGAADDYPIGLSPESVGELVTHIDQLWGTDAQVVINVPSHADDPRFKAWYGKYVRSLGTPTTIVKLVRDTFALDARAALPGLTMPTLVMHRTGYPVIPFSHGQYLAEHIPGAVLVEIPGSDGPLYWETPELILDQLRTFIAGDATTAPPVTQLATILFTDIVRSTEIATSLGDRDWSSVIDVHRDTAASGVEHHGGRLLKWTGDGILATFPDPLLAIAGADEVRARAQEMGITVRLGLHTGRVVVSDDDVTGLAVHIAARVMAAAGGDEIVVSRTVRDLMLGTGYRFRDLGPHDLKGVEGAWDLYALDS